MKNLRLMATLAGLMAATLPETKTTNLQNKGLRRKLRPCINPDCNKLHDSAKLCCSVECFNRVNASEEPEEIITEYPCRVCGEVSEIYCEPHEFDPEMHYCGRSPHCCP